MAQILTFMRLIQSSTYNTFGMFALFISVCLGLSFVYL